MHFIISILIAAALILSGCRDDQIQLEQSCTKINQVIGDDGFQIAGFIGKIFNESYYFVSIVPPIGKRNPLILEDPFDLSIQHEYPDTLPDASTPSAQELVAISFIDAQKDSAIVSIHARSFYTVPFSMATDLVIAIQMVFNEKNGYDETCKLIEKFLLDFDQQQQLAEKKLPKQIT